MQTFLGALSSAWLEHHLDMVGVVGSSPIVPTRILWRHLANALVQVRTNDEDLQTVSLRAREGVKRK